jgi:STE24 endopeptidase
LQKVNLIEEDIERAKEYSKRRIQAAILQFVLTAAFLAIVVVSGTSTYLRDVVAGWTRNYYLQVGLYAVVLVCVFRLLFLPLDFYQSFVLEHKFGLSNQTLFRWVMRSLKKGLVSLPLLLCAAEGLYFSLRHFPRHWWLLVTAAWLLVTVILSKIAPILIIPLFYKCQPLSNDELQNILIQLGTRCGVRVKGVFEIQLSKETKKANAAVAGFGKGRRILLGDTLLTNYSADEIEAVFAHELGHIRLRHTWKILAFGTAVAMACFYLTSLLFYVTANRVGIGNVHDVAGLPLLLLLLLLVGFVLVPIQNGYSRHLETQADLFALAHTADSCSLASALTKLSVQNLSDPSPGRLVELFLYDHPPIAKRVAYCRDKSEA